MKTSSAKAKGRRLALRVKELLLDAFRYRNLCEDDIKVTSSGAQGEDLSLHGGWREIFPLAIECKNVERLNIWSALEQSRHHDHSRSRDNLYCVVFSRNREVEPMVALPLTTLLKFLGAKKNET